MTDPIVIFSSDRTRGGILRKILELNKISSALVNRLNEFNLLISQRDFLIAIIDTKDSLLAIHDTLKKVACLLKESHILVLGIPPMSDTSGIEALLSGCRSVSAFNEPLAPEMILECVKKILSSQDKDQAHDMESDLKQFLRLD